MAFYCFGGAFILDCDSPSFVEIKDWIVLKNWKEVYTYSLEDRNSQARKEGKKTRICKSYEKQYKDLKNAQQQLTVWF